MYSDIMSNVKALMFWEAVCFLLLFIGVICALRLLHKKETKELEEANESLKNRCDELEGKILRHVKKDVTCYLDFYHNSPEGVKPDDEWWERSRQLQAEIWKLQNREKNCGTFHKEYQENLNESK